jgi:hypothetical protein
VKDDAKNCKEEEEDEEEKWMSTCEEFDCIKNARAGQFRWSGSESE